MTKSKRSSKRTVKNVSKTSCIRPAGLAFGALAALALLAGCHLRATYPAAKIADALRQMCSREYKLDVQTRSTGDHGDTLQAFFWRLGLLKDNLEMQPEAADALERVLLCATRVSLSTDAPLKFLHIKMMDALNGSTVSLWRFVPDIKDSIYSRISEDEYLNRLVIEFDPTARNPNPKRDWHEIAWDKPLTMAEFLAKQVVWRIKRQSQGIGLQAHEDMSEPSTLVVVMDNWTTVQQQGARQEEKITNLVEQTARAVIKSYRYTGFNEFVMKDQLGVSLRSRAL